MLQKSDIDLRPAKQEPKAKTSMGYMVLTELLGTIDALPLYWRNKILEEYMGFLTQLALLVLLEKEKFGKNYYRVRRASHHNRNILLRLLRRLQRKAKEKVKKKELKGQRGKKSKSPTKLVSQTKSKRKTKFKKKAKGKSKTKAIKRVVKHKVLKAIRKLRAFKKRVKVSFKGRKKGLVSQSLKSLSVKKVKPIKGKKTKAVAAAKLVKVKKTGKLFFLAKPGAKDMDKGKKSHAKKVKAKAFRKHILTKQKQQRVRAELQKEKSERLMKPKATFFNKRVANKASNQVVKAAKLKQ